MTGTVVYDGGAVKEQGVDSCRGSPIRDRTRRVDLEETTIDARLIFPSQATFPESGKHDRKRRDHKAEKVEAAT